MSPLTCPAAGTGELLHVRQYVLALVDAYGPLASSWAVVTGQE